MNVRTNSPFAARRALASFAATLSLLAVGSTAGAFSTGSPVCKVTPASMAAGQGTSTGVGNGGFVVEVLRAGTPVTTIVPGETLQIRVSHPANNVQRGILIWVDNAQGTSVGAFTAGSGTQVTPGCGATSITQTSNIPVTVRTVIWTVPNSFSGNLTVSTVIVAGSRSDWYGPLTKTLSAAPATPVPGLQTWALVGVGLGLVATAYYQLRQRRSATV